MTLPPMMELMESAPQTRAGWQLRRGALVTGQEVTFSVWAPKARDVSVYVATGAAAGDHPLKPVDGERGVWSATVSGVVAGDRYGFSLDGADPLPDPVSRSQPDGVHKLSEVVDPTTFEWHDGDWPGVALPDFVIYEVHVGTFTPEGTFDAIIPRLPELVALGVTAIELMPVAEFPGRRNWGYDGVNLYAPHHAYGGPEALRRLVNAAHQHGLGVVLDVVYNHVGPEGNYLDQFGPYFTDVYRTPWGRAVNYDGPGSDGVRRWAHDNALYWISEYHVDALRLDAVHGIYDFGALAFLEELSDEVHELGRRMGRKVQLMAESDLNDPRLIRPPEHGGYGVDAQWADDVHHTIHATLTGERHGYYQDFAGIASIADVYREPFFYARRYAPHRDRLHGRSSAGVPRQRFIVCAQNHDQVGNRPLGERLATLVPPDRQRLSAALVLLSPYIPLLFMGEEYGETAPFLYFIEHGDADLVEAVRAGRRREFESIGLPAAAQIDPQAEETFARSRLDWERRESSAGAPLLALYTDLLALRREEPTLKPGASVVHVEGSAEWCTQLRSTPLQGDIFDAVRAQRTLWCAFNLSGRPQDIPVPAEAPWGWRLRLSTDEPGYGGAGTTTAIVAPAEQAPAPDSPKRLIAASTPVEHRARMVRLAPWSAAVYVRDFEDGSIT
ncbi:MAG TPA: malto-oligosyltrehalose trehalohydrolase [Gemmatimonadaceae bacterium]|nr:malto-oligosyltrehalose trehalohydrolase [Gemmatimonadaceae bacterium]